MGSTDFRPAKLRHPLACNRPNVGALAPEVNTVLPLTAAPHRQSAVDQEAKSQRPGGR
jgi:hypothetical protein